MTDVPGPYWLTFTGKDVTVCGRHGKVIERYPLDQEAQADAHRQRLSAGYAAPAPQPVRLSKAQADILRRAREGIQYRAPALAGVFTDCIARGWIVADPTEYGLHVTLTAVGMAVAP